MDSRDSPNISFNFHKTQWDGYSYPFYRWGNQGSESFSYLLKDTQQVTSNATLSPYVLFKGLRSITEMSKADTQSLPHVFRVSTYWSHSPNWDSESGISLTLVLARKQAGARKGWRQDSDSGLGDPAILGLPQHIIQSNLMEQKLFSLITRREVSDVRTAWSHRPQAPWERNAGNVGPLSCLVVPAHPERSSALWHSYFGEWTRSRNMPRTQSNVAAMKGPLVKLWRLQRRHKQATQDPAPRVGERWVHLHISLFVASFPLSGLLAFTEAQLPGSWNLFA